MKFQLSDNTCWMFKYLAFRLQVFCGYSSIAIVMTPAVLSHVADYFSCCELCRASGRDDVFGSCCRRHVFAYGYVASPLLVSPPPLPPPPLLLHIPCWITSLLFACLPPQAMKSNRDCYLCRYVGGHSNRHRLHHQFLYSAARDLLFAKVCGRPKEITVSIQIHLTLFPSPPLYLHNATKVVPENSTNSLA